MSSTDSTRRMRLFAAAAALSALVVALLASFAIATRDSQSFAPEERGVSAVCAHASQLASELGRRELRRAVRCLINQERRARGATKLVRDPSLEHAAASHGKVMVATDCLEHRCPGEASLDNRIATAGYFDRSLKWEYAENTGCAPSAKAMVTSWMASQTHRVYLVDRDFRDLGVGAVQTPVDSLCENDYATFAIVVAWRELDS